MSSPTNEVLAERIAHAVKQLEKTEKRLNAVADQVVNVRIRLGRLSLLAALGGLVGGGIAQAGRELIPSHHAEAITSTTKEHP